MRRATDGRHRDRRIGQATATLFVALVMIVSGALLVGFGAPGHPPKGSPTSTVSGNEARVAVSSGVTNLSIAEGGLPSGQA